MITKNLLIIFIICWLAWGWNAGRDSSGQEEKMTKPKTKVEKYQGAKELRKEVANLKLRCSKCRKKATSFIGKIPYCSAHFNQIKKIKPGRIWDGV